MQQGVAQAKAVAGSPSSRFFRGFEYGNCCTPLTQGMGKCGTGDSSADHRNLWARICLRMGLRVTAWLLGCKRVEWFYFSGKHPVQGMAFTAKALAVSARKTPPR